MSCTLQVIRLVLVMSIIAAVRSSKDHVLHSCQRYKTKSDQLNCDKGNENQMWTSCCAPQPEGSGEGSQILKYKSAVYTINTGAFSRSDVWCDMDNAGGGWLTILRRTQSNTKTHFKRFQEDYLDGFGHLHGDFWLGLRLMHQLTRNGDCEMRIDLYESNETTSSDYVSYTLFKVDSYPDYNLRLGKFDSSDNSLFFDNFKEFNGRKFIVKKSHTDEDISSRCARDRGGWWYKESSCFTHGPVLTKEAESLRWWVLDKDGSKIKKPFYKYEMKIRPRNCTSASS